MYVGVRGDASERVVWKVGGFLYAGSAVAMTCMWALQPSFMRCGGQNLEQKDSRGNSQSLPLNIMSHEKPQGTPHIWQTSGGHVTDMIAVLQSNLAQRSLLYHWLASKHIALHG